MNSFLYAAYYARAPVFQIEIPKKGTFAGGIFREISHVLLTNSNTIWSNF